MKRKNKGKKAKMELTKKQIINICKFYEENEFLPWEKKIGLNKIKKRIKGLKESTKRIHKLIENDYIKEMKSLKKIKKILINDAVKI